MLILVLELNWTIFKSCLNTNIEKFITSQYLVEVITMKNKILTCGDTHEVLVK